ncbi:uncharacterized protein LOC141657940 [Silene latifolia]|uniref:uncharacterized protein LOC141657940 n=1 Tax=Silene latifolia TaxID=37657 RepID=UPI003D784D95
MPESIPTSDQTSDQYSPFDDPLFLTQNDQPNLKLTDVLFDGTNFLQWQRDVVQALLSKNKSGFITGECSMPEKNDKTYNQWISYEQVQTTVLSMDPLPSINRTLGLLQKIEKQKVINDSVNEFSVESASFVSKKRIKESSLQGQPSKRVKDDLCDSWFDSVCEHCTKPGHVIADCHRLKTCTFCNIKGHIIERCYKYRAFKKGKGKLAESCAPTANNVLVSHHDQDEEYVDLSPVDSIVPYTQAVHYPGMPANVPSDMVQGIINFVMQQVSKAYSGENTSLHSAVNFAGMVSDHISIPVQSKARITHSSSWIVDTGASEHITFQYPLLHNVKTLVKPIYVALPDGTLKQVFKTGQVYFTGSIMLQNVLYIPDFRQNLLSVGKLVSSTGLLVCFLSSKCLFQVPSNKSIVAVAQRTGDLYKININSKVVIPVSHSSVPHSNVSTVFLSSENTSADNKCNLSLIHARFGHSSLEKLQHVPCIKLNGIKNIFCETCILAKHYVLPFNRSTSHAKKCFDLIHIDVWGPYRIQSSTGARSFLTVLDDYSRNTWVFLLQNKTQVPGLIKSFVAYVENQFAAQIKIVRSDNGTEIFQKQCEDFFKTKGIKHQRSIAGRPQQNGRVERKHRHLLETARALKFQSNVPLKFWSECLLTATYMINKMPTKLLNWKSPYEVLFGEAPQYDELKVFGSLCFATKASSDKFQPRAFTFSDTIASVGVSDPPQNLEDTIPENLQDSQVVTPDAIPSTSGNQHQVSAMILLPGDLLGQSLLHLE